MNTLLILHIGEVLSTAAGAALLFGLGTGMIGRA